MANSDKRKEPGAADKGRPGAEPAVSEHDRAAAAKDISLDLRELKRRAETKNLKMVAYLLNLAELEALDCAGMAPDIRRRPSGNRSV